MDETEAFKKLKAIKQEHLLKDFNSLKENEQKLLLKEIEKLDVQLFKEQQTLLLKNETAKVKISPFTNAINSESIRCTPADKKVLEEGKIGCLLVAGGQGTRLGSKGPKGTYPLSPVKQKSLFQIFAEKTVAASKLAKRELPLAIMTSDENHEDTVAFFNEHHHFGLSRGQLFFFSQNSLPMLTKEGDLFLETPFSLAKGADGNGSSLSQFVKSGIFDEWQKKGVQFVNYVLVDNPLADPFDEKLLFFQSRQKEDILVKCIKREDPAENVGVLGEKEEALTVLEYSEIDESERFAKNLTGELLYPFANISLFSFSMDFIQKAALNEAIMPLHAAWKKVPGLEAKAWKFERFIFDHLLLTKKIAVIEFPRQECFSPLKNRQGKESVKSVQEDMQRRDLKTIWQLTKSEVPALTPFEIAQDFYYPSPQLIKKWENRPIPKEHYIEP